MTSFDHISHKPTSTHLLQRWGDQLATIFKLPKSPKLRAQYFLGAVVLLLVLVGSGAAYFLAQSNADLRNQASTGSLYGATCSSPLGRPADCTCDRNAQCGSGKCAKSAGDNTKVCQAGALPNPSASPGASSLAVGAACSQSTQCQSGLCVSNKCAQPEDSDICTTNHPTYVPSRGGCVVRN